MGVKAQIEGNVLVLSLSNPPANALSLSLRRELYAALTLGCVDPVVAAVVIHGVDRYFCAGAELGELGTSAADTAPRLSADLLPAIENCVKPVIAALHGAAIGGGFELALACHYRIAAEDTKIALPELKHGIIPLSGTQRLPRIWGVERSLKMIMESATLLAGEFAHTRVFDRLTPNGSALAVALDFARTIAGMPPAQHRRHLIRNLPYTESNPLAALDAVMAPYSEHALTVAQRGLRDAIRAGIEASDFDAGLAQAQRIFDELSTHAA